MTIFYMNLTTFYYGAMKAGKSLHLIYLLKRFPNKRNYTITYSNSRYGSKIIKSRAELEIKCNSFFDKNNLYLPQEEKILFIDEAQFLTKNQVQEIFQYVHKFKTQAYFFGLRSDFEGNLFEGSAYLLGWCNELIEISNKCACGNKSTMNKKISNNKSGDIFATYHNSCYGCFIINH